MNARLGRLETLLARVQHNLSRQPAVGVSPATLGTELVLADSLAPPPLVPTSLDLLPVGDESPDTEVLVGEELELDEPPESGHSRVGETHTMQQAMAEAASQPPLTPPPESGEEPLPRVSVPRQTGPTMAQLGQTIALEELVGTRLDLEVALVPSVRALAEQDELQADISVTGAYSESLPLPDNVREELDRVRLGQSTEVRPMLSARPVLSTNVVAFVSAARSYEPESFLELLDSSLAL